MLDSWLWMQLVSALGHSLYCAGLCKLMKIYDMVNNNRLSGKNQVVHQLYLIPWR